MLATEKLLEYIIISHQFATSNINATYATHHIHYYECLHDDHQFYNRSEFKHRPQSNMLNNFPKMLLGISQKFSL